MLANRPEDLPKFSSFRVESLFGHALLFALHTSDTKKKANSIAELAYQGGGTD